MVKRAAWLSITPEPERELPVAVATLAAGGAPAPEAVARERARIERLVLRGSQRRWLSYLHEVVELIEHPRLGGATAGPGSGQDGAAQVAHGRDGPNGARGQAGPDGARGRAGPDGARGRDRADDVAGARGHAAAVIANHHNLLLALPGPGARLTARDRDALARLVAEQERGRG